MDHIIPGAPGTATSQGRLNPTPAPHASVPKEMKVRKGQLLNELKGLAREGGVHQYIHSPHWRQAEDRGDFRDMKEL